ncbi:MAG TPA: hydrolase, partial [Microbacterium sp.]|nr:hydrolase [Microbacterium sp.]
MRAVTYLDRRGRVWREGSVSVVDGRVRLCADAPTPAIPRLDGVVTGGFTDSHVHLQLVDAEALNDSSLGRVFDLGGNPTVLSGMTSEVEIGFAGAFLTPPGGYPSDRAWAPEGSVREISDRDAAASAIAEMKDAGATCLKVASNSTTGPVFSDELFTAIVEIAGTHNLSVIAHAEGAGEAQRATRLRARVLAHAPFTERLSDAELHAMHGSVSWSSTLAVHEGEAYEIAVDNVRRFHALGGIVVYGTDMGNGPTPVGLNPREIAALREAGID